MILLPKMDAPSQRLQPARVLIAAALWAIALAVAAVILLGHRDPVGVDAVVGSLAGLLAWAAIASLVLAIVLALLWPPFLPWLRLRWTQAHENVEHDAAALREASARLEHFDNAPDRVTLGKELVARRDWARAIPQLVRAVEIESDSLTARQLLGRALLGAGHADKAVEVLREVVRRDEDHGFGDTLRTLGEALVAAGRHDEAAEVLARHEHRFGPHRSVDVLRAGLAQRRGEAQKARELLQRAAAKPEGKRKLTPEEALARGRARVRLWFGAGGAE